MQFSSVGQPFPLSNHQDLAQITAKVLVILDAQL
jgi:hypothetical protein